MSATAPQPAPPVHDLAGIGFGPSNLALAIAAKEHPSSPSAMFFERQPTFGWHRGMLLDDATMQVSFLKDLVTLRNPTSPFSFVCFLRERGRLLDFINHKTLYPLRIEFHEYLQWAADKVGAAVRYDSEVIGVAPVGRDGHIDAFDVRVRRAGDVTAHRTRNIVLATGLEPMLPAGLDASKRIWHSSRLLTELDAFGEPDPRRFVVVGAGQSAAEVAAFLHQRFPAAEVCAVFARYGYSPADDSSFANQIFDPAAVNEYYDAPADVKALLLRYHQNTNYSVVDGELIDTLYRTVYREKVLGSSRLRMLKVSRVVDAEDAGDQVRVTVESLTSGRRSELDADVVVCATGYRSADPFAILGDLARYCHRDPSGRAEVDRDYRLRTAPELRAGIYLQGGTEHTHGITSSLLSNTAVRAGDILRSIVVAAGPATVRSIVDKSVNRGGPVEPALLDAQPEREPVAADHRYRYYVHRLPPPAGTGPLRLMAALARWASGPFVLYERPGTWSLAIGAAYEVVLAPDGIRAVNAVGGGTEHFEPLGAEPLQQVAALLAAGPVEGGRAYGWAAFDLVHVLHEQPDAAAGEAVLRLMVPRQEIRITASGIELRALSAGELAALEAAVAAAAVPADAPAVTPLSADGAAHGAQAYRQVVADAVRDIRARRLQKVILSREVPIEHDVDLYATYEAGRRGNTPARSFLLDLGDLRCAGFSPETVLEVAADGRVATQPLAGTRAFMGDAHVDAGLRADLLEDVKEIFEHAISVKLACDELRAICAGGSVQVGEFMDVAERGSVQHLASRVSGVLAPGRNAWHAMATLFPAITASGVPKVAACSAIRRYEQQPRGLYSGAVITVDTDGGLDAALVLRSIFQAGGRTWLRAGAGVVEHSTPEREYEETCEKLRSISRFIVAAQP